MKPNETEKKVRKRYSLIMWICILYGGFTVILFALDLYTIIWSGGSLFQSPVQPREAFHDANISINDFNRLAGAPRMEFNPLRIATSPFSITLFLSGIIMLAAGFTIWRITREKEIKKIREEAADQFLLPDEKKVIDTLKRNNYSLTQSQITKETGLNKVQVHRVIKRLETKELINKHAYGLTNKIVLKKELFE